MQSVHCSISKVVFDLFFKPVVSGRFGRFHNDNRQIIIISCSGYTTNKTDRHDIAEILLKLALNTINHKPNLAFDHTW